MFFLLFIPFSSGSQKGTNAILLVLSAMHLSPSGWKAQAAEEIPILTSGVGQDFGLFCMDSDFEELD